MTIAHAQEQSFRAGRPLGLTWMIYIYRSTMFVSIIVIIYTSTMCHVHRFDEYTPSSSLLVLHSVGFAAMALRQASILIVQHQYEYHYSRNSRLLMPRVDLSRQVDIKEPIHR